MPLKQMDEVEVVQKIGCEICEECGPNADCGLVPKECGRILGAIAELTKHIETIKQDATTMALRLLGEDENTFSPECYEVMKRWRPIALEAVRSVNG